MTNLKYADFSHCVSNALRKYLNEHPENHKGVLYALDYLRIYGKDPKNLEKIAACLNTDRSYYEEIYDFKENLKNSSYKKKIRKVIKKVYHMILINLAQYFANYNDSYEYENESEA